jgi:all-trans-8'-apo-beta-carotenal 15,15'-oxygenase
MFHTTPTTFNRRHILHAMATGGMASTGLYAPLTQAFTLTRDDVFTRAADGLSDTLETLHIPLRGKIPSGLRGTLYRNGPARFKLGSTHYRHWFDGDGMVQAFSIANGQVGHRGVLLRTKKRVEEETAGRLLYAGFGTEMSDSKPIPKPDTVNAANISMLSMNHGRDLYALWEGGSATQLDPISLDVMGFKAWSPETAGAPFSAHPRRAPDGTVWNFGYAAHSGKLIIYEISAQGQLKRQAAIDAPQADMVHDFAITKNYLVFLLMPLHAKPGTPPTGSLNRYEWRSDAPLIALLVSKTDFSVKHIDLPNGGVFHLGNAWEEGGVIRLEYARYGQFLEHLKGLVLPTPKASADRLASWTQVEINLSKNTARQIDTGLHGIEFPSFDSRHTGEKTHTTVLMQNSFTITDALWGMDTVLTLSNDKIQRYGYGKDWIAEEHLLVPAPNSKSTENGWILGTAFNLITQKTSLSIFESKTLSQGPVAQLTLPYGLPLGLHGQFVPA